MVLSKDEIDANKREVLALKIMVLTIWWSWLSGAKL